MPNTGVMQGLLAILLGVDPLRAPLPLQLLGLILDVALVTATVWAVWTAFAAVGRMIADTLEVQGVKHRLIIARGLTRHDFDQVRKSIRGWRVMVVRYGTEEYLRLLAGEADRNIGRPRHTSSGMKISLSASGEAILSWSLPIHRRLGTQFRCYILTRKGGAGFSVLADILKHYDEIEVLQPDLPERKRIYFLLSHFPEIASAEGVRNNYIAPE
jgi:hypothetical protein